MLTFLLQSGYDLLVAQAAAPSTRLEITGFKVGDSYAVAPGVNYTSAQGNLVFTGGPGNIKYIPFHDDAVMLQFLIDHNDPEIQIGNILIEVDNTPFCICICDYQFIKLSTVTSETGIRYTFQFNLTIPTVASRFDFDNLAQNIAEFLSVQDEIALAALANPMSSHDQAILETHTHTGRMVPVLYINGEYWGCPLMMPLEDNFVIDGGASGDNYGLSIAPPPGFVFILDDDSAYITDPDGAALIEPV